MSQYCTLVTIDAQGDYPAVFPDALAEALAAAVRVHMEAYGLQTVSVKVAISPAPVPMAAVKPSVSQLAVACNKCHAKPGQPCVNVDGRIPSGFHVSRTRAMRRRNAIPGSPVKASKG